MEEKILYIADVGYKVDFENQCFIRIDKPEDVLYVDDMKDEGPHYTTKLRKDTRLPQRELLEWEDSQRLSFGVYLPADVLYEKEWEDQKWVEEINSFSKDLKWNIHVGTPGDPLKLAPPTAEILPVFNANGVEFWVDVDRLELRDKLYAANTISILKDMTEVENGYQFYFDSKQRSVVGFADSRNKNEALINMPELVSLDPEGMARKYGVKMEEMAGKTDFDLMVDQQALQQRRDGLMVTLDVQGQIFYVDHRMEALRPKDDFTSRGISFGEIENYYVDKTDTYIFPYDPIKHELREVSNNILEIPKDLILVEIPPLQDMDRVGYNRSIGVDELSNLKEIGIRPHHVARKVEWDEMGVDKLVQENIKKHIKENIEPMAKKTAQKKGKGRSRKF